MAEENLKILFKLYQKCFFDKNAESEIKSLGTNFQFEILENNSFIIYSIISSDEAEIIEIGTIPEFRNQGLALKLLEKTAENLKSMGIKTIFLEVAENNLAALKLYKNCGFEQYNTRKDYYKSQTGRIDAVLMRLYL